MTIERLPNPDKGFEIDFVDFLLQPEEEVIIQIGWTPKNTTPLRETIIVKFGIFKAQVKLMATCKAPIEKVIFLI